MRNLTSIAVVFLLLVGPPASARRPPSHLQTLIRHCTAAAVVRVERIEVIDGIKIAFATVERRLKGLGKAKRVAFLAQRLRSSDRDHAVAGERAVVLFSRVRTRRLRQLATLIAAMVDSMPPWPLFRIAGAGDGRMPIVARNGRLHASVGHLRVKPGLRSKLVKDSQGSVTLIDLDELERRIPRIQPDRLKFRRTPR